MGFDKSTNIKIIHFFMWIIFFLVTIFCHYYPTCLKKYDDIIQKSFAPIEWFFIWLIFVSVWGYVYFMLDEFIKQ